MAKETKEILEFGAFRLDAAEALLTRQGSPVSMPPKVFDLLVYLSLNAGRLVEKDELLKALWPDSFVEESNLTVNMAALRKVLGAQDDGQPWIETVPKRGYRFVGQVVRPSAEEPTIDALPQPVSITPSGGRNRRYLAGLLAGLIVAAATVYLFVHRSRNTTAISQPIAIAVLPFIELSGQSDDSHVGLGMTDALIAKLGASPDLKVRSIVAVRKYEGADPLETGRALKVDTVLAGSVQRLDKRIRVSVRLLRVNDGQSLWADKFDEFFTNIFAVQDAISEKIAKVMALRLTSEQQNLMMRRFTESTEAFRLYELGRYERLENPLKAREHFEMAIREDPRYALPWVELANSYVTLSGNGIEPFRRLSPVAREAARNALRLAPDLAEAHIAAADVKRFIDRDFKGAERDIETALRLNPQSAMAHDSRGMLLAIEGNLTQGIAEGQIAVRLDPFNGLYVDNLAWLLHCAGQDAEALVELEQLHQRDPRQQSTWATYYSFLGLARIPEAIQLMEPLAKKATGRAAKAVLAHAEALAGRPDEARALLNSLPEGWGQYQRAIVDVTLGDNDAAIAHLDKAVDEHSVFAEWIKVDPDLKPVRADPRFAAIVRRLGLTL